MQSHFYNIKKSLLVVTILISVFVLPSCDITSLLACRVLECEHGTCEFDGETAACLCEPGWSGVRCELEEGGLCAPDAEECDMPPECDGLFDPTCGPDEPPYPPGPDFINKPWGSYRAGIKQDPESPDPALAYDIDLTLDALLQTGQNFYGLSANDDFNYTTLESLLAHEDSSNMNIFAVVHERHLAPTNRWLRTTDDLDTTDYYYLKACPEKSGCRDDCNDTKSACDEECDTTIPECAEECDTFESECIHLCNTCFDKWDEETHHRFLESWKAAAEELSKLSMTYPQLEGFTIDDFGGYVCGPGFGTDTPAAAACFTEAEVRSIRDAGRDCSTCNPDFKFWPTVYFQNGIPKLFGEAHVLGQRSGSDSNMLAGEEILMEVLFDISEIPENFTLSFLYNDGYNDTQNDASAGLDFVKKLFKTIRVNGGDNLLSTGSEPGQSDVWDSQWVESFSQNISEYLDTDDNSITIGLQAADDLEGTNELKFMYNKLLYIWDFKLRANEMELPLSDSTEGGYTVTYITPDAPRNFIAEQASINLADDVDGVFAPTRAPTNLYNDDHYRDLLQRTKPYIGAGDFITVSYGWLHFKEIDSATRVQEIRTGLQQSDRVLVWNLPMPIHYHQEERGIFKQREPGSNYELLSTWPSHEGCMEGWFQEWTTTLSTEEMPTFSFAVNQHDMEEAWTEEKKRKRGGEFFHSTLAHLESGDTLFDSNDEDDKLFLATDYTDTREYTVGASYPSSTFIFRVENISGCGDINHQLKLRLRTADGSTVEGWTYTTGTIIDEIPDVYCEVTQAMMEETGRPSLPFSETWANECLEADASPE